MCWCKARPQRAVTDNSESGSVPCRHSVRCDLDSRYTVCGNAISFSLSPGVAARMSELPGHASSRAHSPSRPKNGTSSPAGPHATFPRHVRVSWCNSHRLWLGSCCRGAINLVQPTGTDTAAHGHAAVPPRSPYKHIRQQGNHLPPEARLNPHSQRQLSRSPTCAPPKPLPPPGICSIRI